MTLGEYLQGLLSAPRQADVHDCCTFPADWAVACGRADPMRQWRGAYRTDEEAENIIAEAGGLSVLFAAGMNAAGIPEVDVAQIGDIGVLDILGYQAGGIFTGRRWAFVPAVRGVCFASLEPSAIVRMWRP